MIIVIGSNGTMLILQLNPTLDLRPIGFSVNGVTKRKINYGLGIKDKIRVNLAGSSHKT